MAAETEQIERKTLGKVRAHQTQNEGLMFEKSAPGKKAYQLPPLDVPAVDAAELLGDAHRKTPGLLPELSEIEIIRHFTRLSTWNYAIDLGMYPLGSLHDEVQPAGERVCVAAGGDCGGASVSAGVVGAGVAGNYGLLQNCLLEITGMEAITLQPAAGAHGEFTGILLVRAYHESQGQCAEERD